MVHFGNSQTLLTASQLHCMVINRLNHYELANRYWELAKAAPTMDIATMYANWAKTEYITTTWCGKQIRELLQLSMRPW